MLRSWRTSPSVHAMLFRGTLLPSKQVIVPDLESPVDTGQHRIC